MTAVAIDFGTSNTVVCVLDPQTQKPRSLQFPGLSRQFETPQRPVSVVPTVAFVPVDQPLLVGETVRSQRLGCAQPDRYFQAFKRDLVADFQPPPRYIGDRAYTAEDISTGFLATLWAHIQQTVNPSQVILTVPVGAFERYLDWFRDVAQQLGLPNVQLLDESTAAALGYAVRRPGSLVLMVDFGGGTLDLSLVRTVPISRDAPVLKAEVVAKADAYIGGIDIDLWLVDAYLRQAQLTREAVGEIGWQNLLEIAETLKIRLSKDAIAKESWFDDETFMAHEVSFTREQFNDILERQQLLEQVRQTLDDVLEIAFNKGIAKSTIDLVLMVGGSSLIPAVQQLVVSYFGKSRVKLHKPFEAVAHGAIRLSQLSGVDDYLHHSYAIRLWEPFSKTYAYHTLFEKGTQYPCQRRDVLTLQVATEGQTEIRLDIGELAQVLQAEVTYDIEGRMTSSQLNRQDSFRSLDAEHQQVCVAHLDPPGQVGLDRISVAFEVSAQRMLMATVRDLLTDQVLVEKAAIAKLH